jgi:hypothetical protein
MILLDKPFVSEFVKDTIRDNALPVVRTGMAEACGFSTEPYLLDEETAIQLAASTDDLMIYTTSENAIGWIAQNLAFTGLPDKIDQFKNKAKFRALVASLHPDFYFKEVQLEELEVLSIGDIPTPFVIKPSVGFFSMGVYIVSDADGWEQTKRSIHAEMRAVKDLYPPEVMDSTTFIIEQYIEGDEYAIDAYFDASGEPVILNILKHVFSSSEDVSDRVYLTSKEIIESNIGSFTQYLQRVGELTRIRNFPVHVEIRRDSTGRMLPIEINPMRFGGWCTTADITSFAYGFNPYLYYFSQQRPDWDEILKDKEGKLYSVIVLDNSTGVDGSRITAFDYDRVVSSFERPLDLRKIDYREYPVFGFVFTETREENFAEIKSILKSDLREFITVAA